MEKDIEEQETRPDLLTMANYDLTIGDENPEGDNESTLPIPELSTMANKILTIKDDKSEDDDKMKLPPPGKHCEWNFAEEFREHLIKIMLPGTSPLPKLNDKDLIQRFGAQRIEKNGKIFYQFDCTDFGGGSQSKTSHLPDRTTICGPTYSAKSVLSLVRAKLKDEKWIRDNVVECITKETKEYTYMQRLVSDCLGEEMSKFYNYVLCLHQQHRNKTP